MPKVSVIIPTHNRAALLGNAIQSVLDQTFEDFELLVVDDGSEDHPEQVVRSFSDPRVRFIRHPVARGGGAARNTGIQNTHGPFVAFLDDDDAWYPEKLDLQVALLEKGARKLALVYGGYDIGDASGAQLTGTKTPIARGNLRHQLLSSNVIGGTSLILVRRAALEHIGGFDENLPSFQDHDLYLRLSEHYKFDFVPNPLLRYHRHEIQIWKNPVALLKGLELMRKKYGTHKPFRKFLARRYQKLGRQLCLGGDTVEGRSALRISLALNPRVLRTYAYYALSISDSLTQAPANQEKP